MKIIFYFILKTEEHKEQMIQILEEIVSDLNTFGTYISIKTLQEAAAFNPNRRI